MRALLLLVTLGACTPEVVSGAYLCGVEASCPDDLACNGAVDKNSGLQEDTCVLPSLARPFLCTPKLDVEPDDTMEQGYLIPNLGCVSIPFEKDACMLEAENADWVTFVAPTMCVSAIEVEARLTFSIAYEELTVELWDFDQSIRIATDTECPSGNDASNVRRCLDFTLVQGTKYAVKVAPTGNATCGGRCAYNRYTLRIQLATPG
jgi:hypothetical protein